MELSVLSSGSSGNCFYVENKGRAILIDAGISAKQICDRITEIGRKPESVEGIFVTHEHVDHVRGADVFCRKFNVPVFGTEKTLNEFLFANSDLKKAISNNETLKIAGLEVEAFSKSHASADPISFNIVNNKRLSIITDAGFACQNIISSIKDADFLCLESNHDPSLLEEGPYPHFLKNWIRSDIGHLSNMQAALAVLEHAHPRMKNLILCHLSETNNTPRHAVKSFSLLKERYDLHPEIIISDKEKPTEIMKI